jgi:hypothetical protein
MKVLSAHRAYGNPFFEALSGMHLSGIEKNNFSRRPTVDHSSILELFHSGINETGCQLVVSMRCEWMNKVASMKNLKGSADVCDDASLLWVIATAHLMPHWNLLEREEM